MARRAGIAGRGNALAGAPPTGSIAAGRSFAGRSFARLALAGSAFAGLTFAGLALAGSAFAGRTFAGGAVTAPAPAIAATVHAESSREAGLAGSVGTAGRGQPERRDLVEAARRQRERVAESRERRGPAPRFTDTDLPRTDRPRTDGSRTNGTPTVPPTDGDRSAGPAGAGAVEAAAGQAEAGKDDQEATPAGDPGDSGGEAGTRPGGPAGAEPPATTNGGDAGDTGDAGADAADAEQDSSPEERAAELREKLLDLEAALATLGVSGLPTAPRHPNRFTSPFDAARLRAEQREIRRELADLESRPGDARPHR